MFRVLLQKNETALRGLCSALLHLPPSELRSVTVKNPIPLSDSIDSKAFVLDVCVLLNNETHLNLEMQVVNYHNWPERSLSYLCRSFDQLMVGQSYAKATPAVHISIPDFDLFPDSPEFYSHNLLMNVKNHKIFTTKFRLNVLCLTQIDQATEEDRLWHIDQWAKLFKATTWEELKMIAKNDSALQSTGETLFTMNADSLIREMARAREDFELYERSRELECAENNKTIAAQKQVIAEKDEVIAEKDEALAENNKTIVAQQQALAEKDEALAEKDEALAEKDEALAEKDEALAEKDEVIAEKDGVIAEKDEALAEKDDMIETLLRELEQLKKGSS